MCAATALTCPLSYRVPTLCYVELFSAYRILGQRHLLRVSYHCRSSLHGSSPLTSCVPGPVFLNIWAPITTPRYNDHYSRIVRIIFSKLRGSGDVRHQVTSFQDTCSQEMDSGYWEAYEQMTFILQRAGIFLGSQKLAMQSNNDFT